MVWYRKYSGPWFTLLTNKRGWPSTANIITMSTIFSRVRHNQATKIITTNCTESHVLMFVCMDDGLRVMLPWCVNRHRVIGTNTLWQTFSEITCLPCYYTLSESSSAAVLTPMMRWMVIPEIQKLAGGSAYVMVTATAAMMHMIIIMWFIFIIIIEEWIYKQQHVEEWWVHSGAAVDSKEGIITLTNDDEMIIVRYQSQMIIWQIKWCHATLISCNTHGIHTTKSSRIIRRTYDEMIYMARVNSVFLGCHVVALCNDNNG